MTDNDPLCKKFRCKVENKEKKQFAFYWGGHLKNWTEICHDPTGSVLQSNILKSERSNLNEPDYEKIAKMFGGNIVGAVHLRGHWYLCNFG